MFYDKFKALCDSVGISCNKAALAMGLSNATPTKWKKTGATPDGSTVAKLTAYFDVPTDFLLERPPFDCWDLINQNRKGFMYYVDIDPDLLQLAWGFDFKDPNSIPMRDFITFISEAIETACPTEEGDWDIKLRPLYQKEKAPTQEGERSVAQTKDEEDMLLLARHMEPIPEEDRRQLKEQFKKSIDLYLKARGLSETEDK